MSTKLVFFCFQSSTKEIASEQQETEFSFTGNENIADKLADPDAASKSKKKRKAQDNLVSIIILV